MGYRARVVGGRVLSEPPKQRSYRGISEKYPAGVRGFNTDGLEVSYNMETLTSGGLMRDFSGNGRHGTITGALDAAGRFGRSRSFDGAVNNTFVEVASFPFDPTTKAYTFFGWFKPSDKVEDPSGASWGVATVGVAKGGFSIGPGSPPSIKAWMNGFATLNSNVPFDTWSAVAVRYTGFGSTSREIFRNGISVAIDASGTVGSFTDRFNVGNLKIYTQTDSGFVDEILVFSRPLSNPEIAALSNEFLYVV